MTPDTSPAKVYRPSVLREMPLKLSHLPPRTAFPQGAETLHSRSYGLRAWHMSNRNPLPASLSDAVCREQLNRAAEKLRQSSDYGHTSRVAEGNDPFPRRLLKTFRSRSLTAPNSRSCDGSFNG